MTEGWKPLGIALCLRDLQDSRIPWSLFPFLDRPSREFLRHLRQNGEPGEIQSDPIVIDDERTQAEIKLLDPSLMDSPITNPPTVGGILRLLMYTPKPLPLIDASDARAHLRKFLRIRGTVTKIEANRRGDLMAKNESLGTEYFSRG